MMWLVVAAVIGMITGVLSCEARTPTYKPLPNLVILLVGMGAVIAIIATTGGHGMMGYAFLGGLIITQVAYAPRIWLRVFPESGFSYWQLVARQFTNPRDLRKEYAAMLGERADQHPAAG
ncbi:hypothetical protein I6E52_09005 [Salinibacterium sp. NG253]|uniref:hypothetical protein n=1 Tax=Salinibacterium sp. NG253 TaxID=2792039 RepID=UPI0018CDF47F|nr:hypothetical protein [Salinibacterium sp. NG253]MBH0116982.1 hypothetical protein [Salinibacterium sp. NG253]